MGIWKYELQAEQSTAWVSRTGKRGADSGGRAHCPPASCRISSAPSSSERSLALIAHPEGIPGGKPCGIAKAGFRESDGDAQP